MTDTHDPTAFLSAFPMFVPATLAESGYEGLRYEALHPDGGSVVLRHWALFYPDRVGWKIHVYCRDFAKLPGLFPTAEAAASYCLIEGLLV